MSDFVNTQHQSKASERADVYAAFMKVTGISREEFPINEAGLEVLHVDGLQTVALTHDSKLAFVQRDNNTGEFAIYSTDAGRGKRTVITGDRAVTESGHLAANFAFKSAPIFQVIEGAQEVQAPHRGLGFYHLLDKAFR